MKDPSNANPVLIEEISALKKRIKELEQSESGCKISEKALKKSERTLNTILDSIPAMIWQKDLDGRYLQVNNAYCATVGLPEDAILGKTDYDIYPKEIADKYVSHDTKVLTSGKSEFGIEEYHRKPSGDYGWSVTDKLVCIDDQGNITGTIGFALDITHHKQAEEKILILLASVREEKNRISALLDSITDEVWFADTQKRFAIANPSASKQFCLKPDQNVEVEKLAKSLEVLRPDGSPRPVEEAPPLRALSGEVVINQEEIVRIPVSGEFRQRQVSAAPVRDSAGRIIGSVSVVRDITELKQAQKALAYEKLRFKQILDNFHYGIYITSQDYRIEYINPALLKEFGDPGARKCYEYFHDLSKPCPWCKNERVFEGEKVCWEWHSQRNDRDYELIDIPLHNDDGTISKLEIFHDVTDRKRAKDELIEREKTLQAFFDAVHESMVLIDAKGFILLSNIVGAERLGKTVPEFVGTCLYDLFPPDVAQHRKEQYEKVVNTGEPVYFQDIRLDRTFEQYCSPVINKEKKVFGVAIFAHEITQRKRAEDALYQSEAKYRSIFENAVEGIFQTTPEGRFLNINPSFARLTGYSSPEELIESTTDLGHQLYVNPEDREQYKKLIKEHGFIEGYEVQQYRKDGSIIWVSINARCVYDENGVLMYYEGTFEDITPRKLAEEKLQNTMEKLRKSLAGTIQIVSMTVETRDPYTAGHQRRVANLARAIAQEMGLSADTVDNIRMAGVIHDIGKISIPAELLAKPTKLTNIEMSLIKVHPQTGFDILKDAGLPYPVAEIVFQHHERLDGSGYPQGLKGDQILLETKILSVADVIEAIATHRPYRPARGIEPALEEIEKNKGVLYDENVVKVCLKLFREKGFKFE